MSDGGGTQPQDSTAPQPATPPPMPPAGWYDDGSGRMRWFDGTQWTEHVQPAPSPSSEAATMTVAVGQGSDDLAASTEAQQPKYQVGEVVNGYRLTALDDGRTEWMPVAGVAAGAPAPPAKKPRRGLIITLGAVGAVLLLFIIIGNINRPSASNTSSVAGTSAQDDAKPAEEKAPEPEMVKIPAGLIGMTAAEAVTALNGVGLKATYDGEADAKVLTFKPNVTSVELGSTVTLTVEQGPVLTLAQKNAVRQAESYLAFMSFSRTGLIGQLEFEGYSTEDATFAVDFVAPDWSAQAGAKAAEYLEIMSFSRDGLYDQLLFEGFTPEEAEAGLASVGY